VPEQQDNRMPKQAKTDQTMPFPILIGDIGGTNARFSILMDATSEPSAFPIVQTADYATIDDAIRTHVLPLAKQAPRSAILAVAGPIKGDEIDLTNCDWVVKPRQMIAELGFDDVLIVNDFEAQALAVATANRAGNRQANGIAGCAWSGHWSWCCRTGARQRCLGACARRRRPCGYGTTLEARF
jgi:glucokinase